MKSSNTTTITVLTIALAMAGCASNDVKQTGSSLVPRFSVANYLASGGNTKSDLSPAEHKHLDTYYVLAQPQSFSVDFVKNINKCVNHHANGIVSAGQGYKVLKSFGYSDEKILTDGIKLCMEAKGWLLYQPINGKLERVTDKGRPYSGLTSSEIESEKSSLQNSISWFRKYAPDVLIND